MGKPMPADDKRVSFFFSCRSSSTAAKRGPRGARTNGFGYGEDRSEEEPLYADVLEDGRTVHREERVVCWSHGGVAKEVEGAVNDPIPFYRAPSYN